MKNHILAALLGLTVLVPPAVQAALAIKPGSKTTSTITANVGPLEYMEVTNEQGGWFGPVEMQQLGAWSSPYEAQLRLRITTFPRKFQVRLDEPLAIRSPQNLVFREPKVVLTPDGGVAKTLEVGKNVEFENPPLLFGEVNFVGHYGLAISAFPPEGNFKDVAGTYTGVLSMTFEPIAQKP